MPNERLAAFFPFLVIDAILVFAITMMTYLDWIVNQLLYDYGLLFSLNWAVPYWTTLRIILVLCGITIVAVTVIGYSSSKRAKIESEKAILVCKSCGAAWTQVDKIVRIRGELPKFKVLNACPSCSDNHNEHTVAVKDDELKELLEHHQR